MTNKCDGLAEAGETCITCLFQDVELKRNPETEKNCITCLPVSLSVAPNEILKQRKIASHV